MYPAVRSPLTTPSFSRVRHPLVHPIPPQLDRGTMWPRWSSSHPGARIEENSSMPQSIRVEREISGRKLAIETGSYAKLAAGAVTVQYGDSVVFGAVVR